MKKTLTILTAVLLSVLTAQATRALRLPVTISQPDGTQLTLYQHGDEDHHWTTTADGTLVIYTQQGCFVAAIGDDGELTATRTLAHDADHRTSAERQLAMQQTEAKRALFHERGLQRQTAAATRRAQISETAHYLPHQGSPRILVILANYQDRQFILPDPVKSFTQFLNGETQEELGNSESMNARSVRKYFEVSSGGKFTPQFDVVGPVMLPDNMEQYGGKADNAGDEQISKLGRDALTLVKDQIDLKQYDNDGDGKVELVYIIHAGYGQNAGGSVETMWAKVSSAGCNIDGVTVSRLGCNSELFIPQAGYDTWITGHGTFCHEFSHAMGLPDLYPTNAPARSVNNQTLEFWSVMDYGLYRYNGFDATLYNAWERDAMGWDEPVLLSETTRGITLTPFLDGGSSFKIVNSAKEEEAFYIENIQKRDENARAMGHGMLVYHVDYASSTVNMSDYPNNAAGHPRVTVVPADGLIISGYQTLRSNGTSQGYGGTYTQAEYRASLGGDPFPGTGNTTLLSDQQPQPGFKYYNGTSTTGIALKNIAEDSETGAVSFDFVTIDKGDVNADEHVNTADIVATTAIILGCDSGNARRADINGDGKVDVSDVTALARQVLQQGVAGE